MNFGTNNFVLGQRAGLIGSRAVRNDQTTGTAFAEVRGNSTSGPVGVGSRNHHSACVADAPSQDHQL